MNWRLHTVVIAVGSHSRKAGKSLLICELIQALPEARWTVVKISGHEHGADRPYSLDAESDGAGRHDTSRYLAAGAARAYLLRHSPDRLAEAVPALHELLAASANVILESNRILEFVTPDLYVFVRNAAAPEFKESATTYAQRADVVVDGNDADSRAALIRTVAARLR